MPPDKVIEVQALIGDSTDNVPGVPGIGVKTAAQLIGEYGDLETLLARAGEIKQEKRRQIADRQRREGAAVEEAGHARRPRRSSTCRSPTSRCTSPTTSGLIAFLKAMEFTTLTRRVAEFAGIDAGRDRGGGAGRGRPCVGRAAGGGRGRAQGESAHARLGGSRASARPAAAAARRVSPGAGRGDRSAGRHAAVRGGRRAPKPRAAPSSTERATRPSAARTGSSPGSRAPRDAAPSAIDVETAGADPMQAELCGISLAVAPNEACYVPLAHRKGGEGGGGAVSRRPRARPDRGVRRRSRR